MIQFGTVPVRSNTNFYVCYLKQMSFRWQIRLESQVCAECISDTKRSRLINIRFTHKQGELTNTTTHTFGLDHKYLKLATLCKSNHQQYMKLFDYNNIDWKGWHSLIHNLLSITTQNGNFHLAIRQESQHLRDKTWYAVTEGDEPNWSNTFKGWGFCLP